MRRVRWWFLIPFGVLLTAALLSYFLLLSDLPTPRRADGLANAATPSILITDRHGRLLYEVIDPDGNKQVPVPLADIPLACRQATIATEDSHFYQHPGVDPSAIGRALWQNLRGGGAISGGSTLTQQLARTLYFSQEDRLEPTLRRKVREAWLAWRLERVYSKDEVLALYLNTAYYGHFAVGLEAAAQGYFGMHARELDLAQCALLAGLPQSPIAYNPVENPDAARNRQVVVLGLMAREGQISAEQAREAAGERLAFAGTPFPIAAPHFVMWAQSQLEALVGQARVRAGGLRVTTTLDLDWQAAAERAVERRLAQLRPCGSAPGATPGITCDPAADPERRVDNAALVALDPGTGAVRALVGSPDYFDPAISGAVNAALSLRQPGSAIKPLTYAAALDPERARAAGRAPWTAATLIADLRTVFMTAENEPYVPNNYDRIYHGPVTVRAALANSYNIPAVKTLDHIGVDALIEQANRLGIPWQARISGHGADTDPAPSTAQSTSDVPDSTSRYGLALTLGGGEVRLLDLTAAYAAFANGGQRVTPFAIERVETLEGEAIWDRAPIPGLRSLDARVAYLITDILSDNNARIPAFGAGNMLEIGRPAAAKTGTTTDWRDNWTVGYTPGLVAGVWVGNADNAPMKDVSGITGAGPIWHDFMVTVLRDTPAQAFTRPNGLAQIEVCADSGQLPGDFASRNADYSGSSIFELQSSIIPCPHRRLEWFIAGTEPTEIDRSHLEIAIDARTGRPADASTPPAFIQPAVIWQLPQAYQAWARENQIAQLAPAAYGALQSAAPTAGVPLAADALRLISPDPNRVYRLDPLLPASAQEVPVTALPGSTLAAEGASITLTVDGAPFAQAAAPDYTAWWPLTRGQHIFQATARGADGSEIVSSKVVVTVE